LSEGEELFSESVESAQFVGSFGDTEQRLSQSPHLQRDEEHLEEAGNATML